jgi:hypothetical protein
MVAPRRSGETRFFNRPISPYPEVRGFTAISGKRLGRVLEDMRGPLSKRGPLLSHPHMHRRVAGYRQCVESPDSPPVAASGLDAKIAPQ